jgi:YgiT-type zinc finger domain-containing protein
MNQKCPVCSGELRKDIIKEDIWIDGTLLVIDNLTAKVCTDCGESIVDFNTMKKIENLIDKFKLKEIRGTEFTAYEIDASASMSA